ncbi:MAG: hypothetical protein ACKVE4_08280 [Dissulfuribacterales bacterium]
MQINLELYSLEGGLLEDCNPYVIKGEHVSRVGEIVELGSEFKSQWGVPTTFIVFDIIWENEDGKLIPYLLCQRWYEGERQVVLEKYGWIHGHT